LYSRHNVPIHIPKAILDGYSLPSLPLLKCSAGIISIGDTKIDIAAKRHPNTIFRSYGVFKIHKKIFYILEYQIVMGARNTN